MDDFVTDEMVETAARAEWNVVWGDVIDWDEADPKSREMFSRGIRPALEAVAPLIAAAALRDAADRERAAWESVPMSPDWMEAIESVCETLRARADRDHDSGGTER